MQLVEALRLHFPSSSLTSEKGRGGRPVSVAFVGAGGKTTALFQLARQLPPPVIVTTTTHLSEAQASLADEHYVIRTLAELKYAMTGLKGVVLFSGGKGSATERLAGLQPDLLEQVKEEADARGIPLLVEADGARQKPLKAPAEHEPVIPAWIDTVIVVAGLSGLGKPLNAEWVHRPELFQELTGLMQGDEITPAAVVSWLRHPQGGLKGIPLHSHRVALLNQADAAGTQAQAHTMAETLLADYERVIVASLGLSADQSWLDVIAPYRGPVYASFSRVAGILLAGDGSSRLGRPKQTLDWFGVPFVRQVAETALNAGLSPMVVVTGAARAEVEHAVQGLPVILAHNLAWAEGQSTSIRTGLGSLPGGAGGAIFLMTDQPQLPVSLIHALLEIHRSSPAMIVAPQVDGQRANPVLFDQVTFAGLMALKGDVGGRALFSKYPVTWLPWLDARLRMDVDTLADYQALLDAERE
jgi:molybdenum cofactor cytidylyltransferase